MEAGFYELKRRARLTREITRAPREKHRAKKVPLLPFCPEWPRLCLLALKSPFCPVLWPFRPSHKR